ncbi:hypothetical protein Y695_02685 [Hydrogenophaga sp. T4]|nr:hypothetical protein Y695_02685 [Hydrogenophaga sp. T4]
MQVGVEVAFPVVPEPPGVVLEVGAFDAAALERGQRVAAVEARRVVDEVHHVLGQSEVLHDGAVDAAHRRQRHQPLLHALRDEAHQRGVDEQVHLGRVGRFAQDVEHIAHAVAHRVDQVEAGAAAALLVADVVQRVDHEVHRHDVDAPALQPHAGHPRRQDLAHALDQLEEVVGPVDLVHLAGATVTHHQRRAVHAPGHFAFGAHDLFALVLGHEIRVVDVLGLVEHVFAEHTFVQARRRNRRHVVEVLRADGLGQFHRVAGAVDVDGDLALGVRLQVVDGSKVVEVIDLALQRLDVVGAHAELLRRQVTKHRHHARGTHAPEFAQIRHLGFARRADQEMHHRSLALQQFLDEPLADETGGAGDEIMHGVLLPGVLHKGWNQPAILHHALAPPIPHKPAGPAPGFSWPPLHSARVGAVQCSHGNRLA